MSRRWPSSSSGSSSTRRLAASMAPPASPAADRAVASRSRSAADGTLDANGAAGLPIVERRAVAECEAGQERASGERGGRLEIGRPGRGRQPLELHEVDARGRRIESDLRPADRRSPAGPIADRSADSVRRSAPRAASSSASGQNIAASSSRANGRPSAATRATIASALRVSTTIGSPATMTSSGPSRRISSGTVGRSRRNGT